MKSEVIAEASRDFCIATLDALPAHLCVIDRKGLILFVNNAWRRFADENPPAPENYCIGHNYLDICDCATGDDAEQARIFARGLRDLLDGTKDSFEFQYTCHAPQEERWFLGRASANVSTPFAGLVITHTDITKQHRVNEALLQSEELYRETVSNISDAVILTDDDNRFVLVCTNVERIFGWPADEVNAMGDMRTLVGPSPLIPADLHHELKEVEWTITNRSGHLHNLLVHIKPVRIGRGTRLFTCHDITDLRKADQELHALAGHLQSAREEERRSIAREIHDHFGQVLSALKIDLGLMMKDLRQSGENGLHDRLLNQLGSYDDTLKSVIVELRRLVTHLRPEILEAIGIVAAMDNEVREFERASGLPSRFSTNVGDLSIDPEVSIALYRILQESLTNIRLHAEARNVSVTFDHVPGALVLQIADDGRGMQADPLPHNVPYGILGMKERALLLKGELSIIRSPAGKTIVSARIPWPIISGGARS
jgi:PAS domain S-box-containing protein